MPRACPRHARKNPAGTLGSHTETAGPWCPHLSCPHALLSRFKPSLIHSGVFRDTSPPLAHTEPCTCCSSVSLASCCHCERLEASQPCGVVTLICTHLGPAAKGMGMGTSAQGSKPSAAFRKVSKERCYQSEVTSRHSLPHWPSWNPTE